MKDIYLIFHFIGLAMALGTSFANLFLSRKLAKLPQEEATRLSLHTSVLVRMGQTGLALLILSGIFLLIPLWPTLSHCAFFLTKLVLVVILTILVMIIGGHIQKAHQGDAAIHLAKVPVLGKVAFIIGIIIVILAVNVFH